MPSLLEYTEKFGKLPNLLSFSLAALLRFYKGEERDGEFYGKGEKEYLIRDDKDVCRYFANLPWEDISLTVKTALANTDMWGRDLNEVEGLCDKVVEYITKIDEIGAKAVMESII